MDKTQLGFAGKALSTLGEKTLDIYIYHGFVLSLLNLNFFNVWVIQTSNILIEVIISFIISIVVAITAILIGEIVKTSSFLTAIVYGEFGKNRDKKSL
jgi:fucose 4-O-acetylase-like acetyltransferase